MLELEIIKELEEELRIKLLNSVILVNVSQSYKQDYSRNITYLNLSKSGIKNIKNIIKLISKLRKLETLDLSHNEINSISNISELNELNLKRLDISHNKIANINSLVHLKDLKELNLSGNKLKDVSVLLKLKQLTLLNLNSNLLVNPLDIENLIHSKNLKQIFILGNEFESITKNVYNHIFNTAIDVNYIRILKHFSVSQQQYLNAAYFRDIESFLLDGYSLNVSESLKVKEILIEYLANSNPFKSPPVSVLISGNESVKNYFEQVEKEHGRTEYLFETKLLVIGEGGTGKTTFIKKIQDPNAKMPLEKDTTLGIHIGKWTYEMDFHNGSKKTKVNFHVNFWDFGGQKIYQGTHQIFFSEKSFYVLIADTREQKTDFSYWLNTVEQLGGDESMLIIVLNNKFGHIQKFDEIGYRSYFGNIIKDVVDLDLKEDKQKILNLQEKVKMYLKSLPGIGDSIPFSWLKIRERLLDEKVNFISFDKFKEICKENGIQEYSNISTLSNYLNRIGAFTHYIDDPVLQERVFLNSNWLVKTIYEVLDNELSKSKKGRLKYDDINEIWGNNNLQYEVNKLTQLMHKFGMMYHITGTDKYVVPAHLPTIKPYTEWKHNNKEVLNFIYEFDKYMPQGIMSRLIVSLNHHIKNHDLVWHRGVNVEIDGACAEIIETYGGNNRFEIKVVGTNKLELLAIIRERFAEVLKPFNKLNYKQYVPCICDECIQSNEPAFHEYNLLLKFREKGMKSQCVNTGEVISAESLLKITEFRNSNVKAVIKNKSNIKTIKIFLASSSELIEERKLIREFISVENDCLHSDGIYLKIEQWEHFFDTISKDGLQHEYNMAAKNSDIFLSLFFTKVGKYTEIEFENAFGNFKSEGKPFIYTFFKNVPVEIGKLNKDDIDSRFLFEKKLIELNHYKTEYTDVNDLLIKFKRQLEIIIPKINNPVLPVLPSVRT